MVGVGAPQIDEARFYAHRSLDLDMEEKIKLAEESASRRSAGDEYTAGFHAAVVYSCLNHMAYVSSNSEQYGNEGYRKAMDADFKQIKDHLSEICSADLVDKFILEVQKEFSRSLYDSESNL